VGEQDVFRKVITLLVVVSMTVVTASCASKPPEKPLEVYFTSIALVSPKEVVDQVHLETRGDRAQEGAGKGAAAGTLGGAAAGALFCGPFLYGLCITALMSAGLLAGGVGGALYGFTGFPNDVAKELQRDVEALSQEHDLPSLLVANVREQVAPEMLADAETAEVQAVLTITNMDFTKKSGRVRLVSSVRASFQSTESRRVPEYGFRDFAGRSEKFELDDLLDSDSGKLEEALRQSLMAASDQIVEVLSLRWRP
jgi:hypothetical protein